MQRLPYKQSLLAGAAALTIVGSVFAIGPNAKAEEAQQSAAARQATAQATAQAKIEAAQTRLADAKLKACQKHETVINNLMGRLADRGAKQLDVFNKIADRTEAFYTSKGKTLSNYDTLVADVNTNKASAQAALSAIKSDSVSFKCDGTDPKGVAASFKTDLKSEIAALKAYKTAIKNLIVGVKSLQGTTSASATDNKTPGAQQ